MRDGQEVGRGSKPQHLKDTLVHGHGDELGRAMADVINLLASGRAHQSARQWICCASLTALAKPDGGLRPIAIGETIRRLTVKLSPKALARILRPTSSPPRLGSALREGPRRRSMPSGST